MIGSKLFFTAVIVLCGLQSVCSQQNGIANDQEALLSAERLAVRAEGKSSIANDLAKKLSGNVRGKKSKRAVETVTVEVGVNSTSTGGKKSKRAVETVTVEVGVNSTSTGGKKQSRISKGSNSTNTTRVKGETTSGGKKQGKAKNNTSTDTGKVGGSSNGKKQEKKDKMASDVDEVVTIQDRSGSTVKNEIVIDLAKRGKGRGGEDTEVDEEIKISGDPANGDEKITISFKTKAKGEKETKAPKKDKGKIDVKESATPSTAPFEKSGKTGSPKKASFNFNDETMVRLENPKKGAGIQLVKEFEGI